MARVILGAAHTLMQPGEVFKDLREADLTRKMLKLVVPHLEKSGIEFKTVPLDLPLLQRIDWINKTGYSQETDDIFIELHVNDGAKRGIEVWYSGDAAEDNPSQRLGEFLVDELCTTLKYDSQGAKSEHEHELTSLLILNQTKTISIAAELLFIDNPEDIKILKDDTAMDNMMKVLVDVIKKFFDDIKTKPLQKAPKVAKNAGPFGSPSLPSFGGITPPGGMSPISPSDSGKSKKSALLMDRDERKQMIIDTYKKIFENEPKQNDLNYYLNMAVGEEELIQKLIESEDFKKMRENAVEAKKLKEDSQKNESELAQLRAQVTDLQAMHTNLNRLLAFKNQTIQQMQQELVNRGLIKKGQYFDPQR